MDGNALAPFKMRQETIFGQGCQGGAVTSYRKLECRGAASLLLLHLKLFFYLTYRKNPQKMTELFTLSFNTSLHLGTYTEVSCYTFCFLLMSQGLLWTEPKKRHQPLNDENPRSTLNHAASIPTLQPGWNPTVDGDSDRICNHRRWVLAGLGYGDHWSPAG